VLFLETRPTLVLPPTLKFLWTLYWGPNFLGSISIADWLLPHHASCPDYLYTKITTCQSEMKVEGDKDNNV